MTSASPSLFTICGLEELGQHSARGVTHVLSILDPDCPEPPDFGSYDPHHRTTFYFHDVIAPGPNLTQPQREDVAAILDFGQSLAAELGGREDVHLLVHCHLGVSRSTAAVAMLLAQSQVDEDTAFARVLDVRRQAWPNSLMVAFADELLGLDGRLCAALGKVYARQLQKLPDLAHFMRSCGRGREIDMALEAEPA